MRKLLAVLLAFIALVAVSLYATADGNYPALQNGDLVFQTSTSSQSGAIFLASASFFTHMGIIKNDGNNTLVIEAAGKVKETPLKEWVNRGLFKRVAIYRNSGLTAGQGQQIVSAAKAYYGKPYDIFFSFNNDAIYCSELPYLAYKEAGISIGRIQKLSELDFDNMLVKKLIGQRWEKHSECKANGYDFEQCYQYILKQELVTPASIARDTQFERIYSNYGF